MNANSWSALAAVLGTLVALGVATYTVGREWRERRRRHVDAVTVWSEMRNHDGEYGMVISIHNGGRSPLTRVRLPAIKYGDDGEEQPSTWILQHLGPDQEAHELLTPEVKALTPVPYAYEFDDAAGRRWRKQDDGVATELTKTDPTIAVGGASSTQAERRATVLFVGTGVGFALVGLGMLIGDRSDPAVVFVLSGLLAVAGLFVRRG